MNKKLITLTGIATVVALLGLGCSMSPAMTHSMSGSMAAT